MQKSIIVYINNRYKHQIDIINGFLMSTKTQYNIENILLIFICENKIDLSKVEDEIYRVFNYINEDKNKKFIIYTSTDNKKTNIEHFINILHSINDIKHEPILVYSNNSEIIKFCEEKQICDTFYDLWFNPLYNE